MSATPLIEAVMDNQLDVARQLLESGADSAALDEHGWTALHWAAGRGQLEVVELLLRHGANPFATGNDQRTPYKVALAARHVPVARALADAEGAAGGDQERVSSREGETRPYCKAYVLGELRRFAGWREPPDEPRRGDEVVVFIHRDFSVTASMWHAEDVLFDGKEASWQTFARDSLGFRVPTDLDLIPTG